MFFLVLKFSISWIWKKIFQIAIFRTFRAKIWSRNMWIFLHILYYEISFSSQTKNLPDPTRWLEQTKNCKTVNLVFFLLFTLFFLVFLVQIFSSPRGTKLNYAFFYSKIKFIDKICKNIATFLDNFYSKRPKRPNPDNSFSIR